MVMDEKPSMNKELEELLKRPTASIPDVGRICFGLTRNASYRAAKEGVFPVIDVGPRTKKALTAPLREILGMEPKS